MFVWSKWLPLRSDFKPDGSSLTPSGISARTLTPVLMEHHSTRNISSWSALTPGAGVLPSFCRKHGWKSVFRINRLFPHAFGIMFVTNWLLWKSLMMQADRPALSGGGTPGWLPIPPPPCSAAVWSSHGAQPHQFELEALLIPLGLWGGTSSCPCTITHLPCLI